MPTVTLNKEILEKLMGKKLSLEELKDRISMIGTDLEKIEGNDIVVEVFPNRPDMLSEAGFARALSAFIGVKTGLREYKVNVGPANYKVIIDRSVHDVRPFTACAIVKNLNFDDEKIREIIQLQEKLHVTMGRNRKKLAIGIYPLEKIKLPIHYIAKKPDEIMFRPLESEKEMTGREILEKHPTGKDFAHLLEGKKHYPVFIDSAGEYLSMPPIINSHRTGRVTEDTKDVFIECSGFDLAVLRQCLNIIVTSLADIGGKIYEMKLEYDEAGKKKTIKTPDLKAVAWNLDFDYVNKMLGMKLSEKAIKTLLERMNYGYKKGKVLVPAYRSDILHQIDLAEDIAIAYGYEKFEPEIPKVATIGAEDELEVFKTRLANILAGFGLIETMNYHLTNKDLNNDKMLHNSQLVELENSLTQDRGALRNWILPSLMQVFAENTNKEYPQNIFEIGNTFHVDEKEETGVRENYDLAIALAGPDADFTRAKQLLDGIANALDFEYEVHSEKHSSFIPGRSARIRIKPKAKDGHESKGAEADIGLIGELHPQVITSFRLEMPVAGLEININELHHILKQRH